MISQQRFLYHGHETMVCAVCLSIFLCRLGYYWNKICAWTLPNLAFMALCTRWPHCPLLWMSLINTLRPRQNCHHFADDIFKCIFFSENVWFSFKISLKFVPKVRINNISALVQTMAWCRPGDKPLSEPMVVMLLTHIGITRPQWVNANPGGLLSTDCIFTSSNTLPSLYIHTSCVEIPPFCHNKRYGDKHVWCFLYFLRMGHCWGY